MTMEVLKYPDPLLRRSGRDITEFDDDLNTTVENMLETMYQYRGVGLAAPQVGLDLNLLVLNPTGAADEADDERVLINPKIKSRKKLEYGEEGCLSFPGIYAEVERHRDIVVEYQDPTGVHKDEKLGGFLARIILHEMDHLNGVLFVDRLSPAERIRVRSKLAELEKRFAQNA
jgi:peptide deformylase